MPKGLILKGWRYGESDIEDPASCWSCGHHIGADAEKCYVCGALGNGGEDKYEQGTGEMTQIERRCRVTGERTYLILSDANPPKWGPRFWAADLLDEEAERLAEQMSPEMERDNYVLEVLY